MALTAEQLAIGGLPKDKKSTEFLQHPQRLFHYGLKDRAKKVISMLFELGKRAQAKAMAARARTPKDVVFIPQGKDYIADRVKDKDGRLVETRRVTHGLPISQGGDGRIHGPNEP